MRLRFLLLALALMAVAWGHCAVEWLETEYDFGLIKESEGPAKGRVSFVNAGPGATFINRVRPSCGCTGASYTSGMIEPGDTATIEFTYNPQGRPGRFEKTVKVYIGEDNELQTVRIRGTVLATPVSLSKEYPVMRGPLRFQRLEQSCGELKRGASRHIFFNVYNQSEHPVTPEWHEDYDALLVDFTPKTLQPGEIGTFSFYLRTSEEPSTGPLEYPVSVRCEGMDPVELRVECTVLPAAAGVSQAELDKAPQAFLEPEYVDLGRVKAGSEAAFRFGIHNDGGSELKVERVWSRDKGVEIKSFPRKVKKKKIGMAKGTVDFSGRLQGPFRIKVSVATDAPLHPLREFSLTGELE